MRKVQSEKSKGKTVEREIKTGIFLVGSWKIALRDTKNITKRNHKLL